MRTLVYCTAYAVAASVWGQRNRRWVDAVVAGLNPDQVLLVDDGSAVLPGWSDLDLFCGGVVGEAFTTGPRGRVLLYHFRDHLGRRGLKDFPGWHRSFVFGALYAEALGFDRVIHIESDAFVISEAARAFLMGFKDGWAGLWSPLYAMPESAIQVAAGDGLRALAAFARAPYAGMIGQDHERALPFTHVERGLTGDRYGEGDKFIPGDADYAAQVPSTMDPAYYWWLRGAAPPPAPVTSIEMTFCENGYDTGALAAGWAPPEMNYHWMVGPESVVRLPALPGEGDGRLVLQVVPHIHAGILPRQRLIVEFNGVRLGEFDIERDCAVACALPAGLPRRQGQNVLRLIHPDAAIPSVLVPKLTDTRRLALSVSRLKLERW